MYNRYLSYEIRGYYDWDKRTFRRQFEKDVKFSIIIPAHNEEKYIGKYLDSIVKASEAYKEQTEVIVVLNRCTDKTEEIAKSYHCITLKIMIKTYLKSEMQGRK